MQRKIAYFLTLTALVLALSACGGNDNKESGNSAPAAESASTEVVIKAASWEFDEAEYAIPKDTPVQLTVENLSGAHGIEIIGQDIEIRGGKSEVVTLPAGTYEIKCNIQCGTGHTKMTAKLVVS
ncbi:cytochrome C oxidase subunit II [Cohnella luojiensis]|uniref:Cytochrome C oxidase subunit II n=1 Tax=Cohnella luojiensis TaxID=652876 RepID=A0A4Y8M639_9BACL|nr:cytochrome C oxidase subunit II [Cohnella luojiensis]TFE28097.1 cytochrome C oxidase subunit II [Cohnella luojiensis]